MSVRSKKKTHTTNAETTFSGLSSFVLCNATNKKLYTWGDNSTGCLGLGHTNDVKKPQLLDLPPLAQVAMGFEHVVALTQDHEVMVWGSNQKGQLGLDRVQNSHVPTPQVLSFP